MLFDSDNNCYEINMGSVMAIEPVRREEGEGEGEGFRCCL